MNPDNNTGGLRRRLSPFVVWAFAFGCAVGWGAFMMPGNSFLPVAGPLGSLLGFLIGSVIMIIVAVNYDYMINIYPDAGGAYTFIKKTMNYDHAFLGAWFLLLTYIAILWANASALPLIFRNLVGDVFQFGLHYQVAGFDVYMGEILLASFAILLACVVCFRVKLAGFVQAAFSVILLGGVALCFIAAMRAHQGGMAAFAPAFQKGGSKVISVFNIVAMAPWAFIGFESISHSVEEFSFSPKKSLKIMIIAVITSALAYTMLIVVAASVQPQGFGNWQEYIAGLGSLSGTDSVPVFYAVKNALGNIGTPVLVFTILGGVITGLLGNFVGASRLIYSMAKEELLPASLAKLDKNGVPRNAVIAIMCVSVFIPLFGRTAIGWIVDVTTIGAAIVYAYTSACAFKTARENGKRAVEITGLLGIVISLLFLLFYLVPNLLAVSALSTESYLIIAAWSIIGFFVFRLVFDKDPSKHMGRSTVVWVVLIFMIMFTSLVWVRQVAIDATRNAIRDVDSYYAQELEAEGVFRSVYKELETDRIIESEVSEVSNAMMRNSIMQMALVVISMGLMFSIYSVLQNREKKMEVEKILAEETSRAKTSFLSNMSHEIRTPMNAIIGLDNIALKDPDLPPKTREQLEKIGASAKHLLGLINDILDMSRIESGRMVLKNEEFEFGEFLDQINVMINGQCVDKGLNYECAINGPTEHFYVGDDMKLKQVLINILGNAVKFTEAPGTVTLTVEQTASFEDHRTLCFKIKDTGIGMDKEYIPKIFEAFSQEDATTNRYGGSGLGMAITKNIVEMMNGDIQVDSEKGVGSTFTVTVSLRASGRSALDGSVVLPQGLKVLVVDDDSIACEHIQLVLGEIGIDADAYTEPLKALEAAKKAHSEGKPYKLIVTDLRMPQMSGLELTSAVRGFDNGETAVILLTGYNWDDLADEIWRAGVDSVLSKPLFSNPMRHEIISVLEKKGVGASKAPENTAEAAPEEGFSLEGLHVLMAEDVELNAEILADILDMEGISCERAENGQTAVDMFAASEVGHFDAVLMDVRMPVMDGLAATKAIRALDRPDAASIPIIAMTANAFDEDVQRSLQAGMNAHLSKPVDPDRLYETLAGFLYK